MSEDLNLQDQNVTEEPEAQDSTPVEPEKQAEVPPVQYSEPAAKQPQPTVPKKEKKKGKAGWIALLIVVALLVGGVGGFYSQKYLKYVRVGPFTFFLRKSEDANKSEAKDSEDESVDAFNEQSDGNTNSNINYEKHTFTVQTADYNKSLTPADVYEKNVDAVVGITTETTTTNIFGQVSSAVCGGSGFIFTSDGYIITNAHVVEGAKSVQVTLHNGDVYDAKIIGSYSANDVALLKIDAKDLQAVTIGKSSELRVGEQVAAIGNPLFELTYSLTVGYVSALSRSTNIDGTPLNVLQTDVAINSGNSGGPLFDMNGNVVGITNAKRTGQSSSGALIEGISFSIPIDDVLGVIQDLMENGRVTGLPYLGVVFKNLDSSLAEIYKLPVGPYVTDVVEGTAAEKAGLQVGDIVLEFNGTKVSTRNDVILAMQRFRAGDSVVLTVYRNGEEIELTVVLDERPEEEESKQDQTQQSPGGSYYGYGFPYGYFFGY